MASIEFIQKRITGKETEIQKLERKLDRIRKAEASGWKDNPYYYHEDDLKWTTRDLERAREALAGYKDQLATETEKANSRNVPAIVEFLDRWKANVTKFYLGRFAKYPEALAQYESDMKPYQIGYFAEQKMKKENPDGYKVWKREKNAIKENFNLAYGILDPYLVRKWNPETESYSLWDFDGDKLAKDLTQEANRKYDNIIERTNDITGTITDASGLEVGEKGELDGYVIGTKGTAHVHTIGAGGYNIQCYHFRVLVHKVR